MNYFAFAAVQDLLVWIWLELIRIRNSILLMNVDLLVMNGQAVVLHEIESSTLDQEHSRVVLLVL